MGVYTNRTTLGGRRTNKPRSVADGSKVKYLLSEDTYPEVSKRKPTEVNQSEEILDEKSLDQYWERFKVVKIKYDYPKENKVPAGWYYAEIEEMNLRIKDNRLALDIGYYIENRKGAYQIMQTYYEGSTHYQKLCSAVIAAGINTTSDIRAAIGMRETICLAYVSKTSDIGSIIERTPWLDQDDAEEKQQAADSQADQDDDSEFDDFLEDED